MLLTHAPCPPTLTYVLLTYVLEMPDLYMDNLLTQCEVCCSALEVVISLFWAVGRNEKHWSMTFWRVSIRGAQLSQALSAEIHGMLKSYLELHCLFELLMKEMTWPCHSHQSKHLSFEKCFQHYSILLGSGFGNMHPVWADLNVQRVYGPRALGWCSSNRSSVKAIFEVFLRTQNWSRLKPFY